MTDYTPAAPNRVAEAGVPEIVGFEVDRTAGTATIAWRAEPGATYRVEFREQLGDGDWGILPGDVTAEDGEATKVDATIGVVAQRFYRVVKLPAE